MKYLAKIKFQYDSRIGQINRRANITFNPAEVKIYTFNDSDYSLI